MSTLTFSGSAMENILLIEDERDVADSVEKMLSRFGYQVIVAYDGKEGIRVFDEYPDFECVVTGISMPKMNGNEVAKHIRSSGRPDTPVVAITGHVEEAIERGLFNLSLIKPFKIRSLISAIKSLASGIQPGSPGPRRSEVNGIAGDTILLHKKDVADLVSHNRLEVIRKKLRSYLSQRRKKERRSGTDRRSKLGDRRIGISIGYFLKGEPERRSWKERRSGLERRSSSPESKKGAITVF